MKYCRWTLKAYRHQMYCDDCVYYKAFRTLDEVVKVAVGFPGNVDFFVYDNDDVSGSTTLDISDLVESQRDFERHFYTE